MARKDVNDFKSWDLYMRRDIPEDYILENAGKIDWNLISYSPSLTEGIIRKYPDRIDWFTASAAIPLSEDFIREFRDKVDWRGILMTQGLSEGFIREFKDVLDRDDVALMQPISEDFMREFHEWLDPRSLIVYQALSEEFIETFHGKDGMAFDILKATAKNPVSEDFIRRHTGEVDWGAVSRLSVLSEDFIREFSERVDWRRIYQYQRLSPDFREEFIGMVDPDILKSTWLYKDTEFKKRQVQGTGLYECHDDHFIAYKGIRWDRRSSYTFRYRYERGGVYETNADHTDRGTGHGFSAWTRSGAENYCRELIVRVRIRYEDVARVINGLGDSISVSYIPVSCIDDDLVRTARVPILSDAPMNCIENGLVRATRLEVLD